MLIIFTILSLLEMARHWYVIKVKKRSPNKLFSFILRCAFAAVLGFYDPLPKYIVIPTYSIIDWWIHDYVLNLARGVKPIWYLNTTGFLDKLQRKFTDPYVWFIWKTIALVAFTCMYYMNF